MTKLGAAAQSKIAKVIPRLASDQNGEVLATVDALKRILAAEGLDFHDLATWAIEQGGASSTPAPQDVQSPTAKWRDAGSGFRDLAEALRRQMYDDMCEGVDLDELKNHWPKLRDSERKLVRQFERRYYRCEPIEMELVRKLERLSVSVGGRARVYAQRAKVRI